MPTVLIVDDSALDRRLVGGILSKVPDLTLEYASDGAEAIARMEQKVPQLVVTDLIMPNMDGLDLVAAIVSRYPLVPVILMTGKGSEEIAVQALQSGASSYVPKSALAEMLVETVEDVLRVAAEEETHARLLDAMIHNDCAFVLENDFTMIPPLVNYLHRSIRGVGICDEATGIRVCVALEEAINNAMFHGNLELGSELRDMDRRRYREFVEQRRRADPYCHRRTYVAARFSRAQAIFVVRDEGPGFNPSCLPDPTEPVNLEKPSGRGLLLMRTFMDEVRFNNSGNEVTLIKRSNCSESISLNGGCRPSTASRDGA